MSAIALPRAHFCVGEQRGKALARGALFAAASTSTATPAAEQGICVIRQPACRTGCNARQPECLLAFVIG